MNDDQHSLIAWLEAQEERLVFTRFDNADAWRLGSAMVAAAMDRALPVTIDIRRHGHQLFHAALPGTTAENDSWIERKVNVVNRFAASSYLVGRRLAASGTALVQWHALVGASDYLNMSDSTWPGGDPERGNLEPSVLGALCAVLAEHTATPQACLLGLWYGYGFIDGGWTTVAYPVGSGRAGGAIRNPPAFSRDRPTLVLPAREYFLFRGPIAAALEMSSRWDQSPNLFWPGDRAWFMAGEIGFDSTVIGGSSELAQALLAAPQLDAWPVDHRDLLSAGADEINLVSPAK
jgi:uncharacterized protein (UPF0303 family)